jgi:hypothetical protein
MVQELFFASLVLSIIFLVAEEKKKRRKTKTWKQSVIEIALSFLDL